MPMTNGRRLLLGLGMIFLFFLPSVVPQASAQQESPYRITEFPVPVAANSQGEPVVSGKWVLWREYSGQENKIFGRNLLTGLDFSIKTGDTLVWPVDIDGDTIVTTESTSNGAKGIFGYRLPEGQRFVIAEPKGDNAFIRGGTRISGSTVVWLEGTSDNATILGYDLTSKRLSPISTQPSSKSSPAISGNTIVWKDQRNSSTQAGTWDIYGYDMSTGLEFRITSRTENVSAPDVSGGLVVWTTLREDASYITRYDLTKKQEFAVARMSTASAPDIDGDIIVWSAKGELDEDIFAYDLKQGKQFVISRAIGVQRNPRLSGKTVVWHDTRNSGVGLHEYDSDVYGARLDPGPAPIPPATGALDAADAKIEIVWPQGKPVTEADKANIGAWLFRTDTLNLTPCQWNPKVRLWRAVNNEPARPIMEGQKDGNVISNRNRAVPVWLFNNVDVEAARDPKNKIYFFVTLDNIYGRTNVWAHGSDPRTYFPDQDVPTGIGSITGAVDAKIEIVWPHDNLPVEQAKKVNISAILFAPGTDKSVPPEWYPLVRLYGALNNDVSREIAVGRKRLVQVDSLTYPVWDFNNIDVSAANDPAHKYYFTLAVDGATTYTNVWVHGADARTYFPQMDTPTQECRGG